MNGIFDNLTFVLLMWILGIIFVLGFIIVSALLLFKFFENKQAKIFALISVLICITGVWLILPFYTYPIAVLKFGNSSAIKILKFTDRISVIPAIRTAINYELSRNYQVKYDGKNAIKYYEKAASIAGKPNRIEQGLICHFYFWKGDRAKIQEVCYKDVVAVDYLRSKEYKEALETINTSIKKYEEENRTNGICSAHSIRAAIYKQTGNKSEYKKDYDLVKKTCPTSEIYKKYMDADDILDVYLGGKEINKYEF